MTETPINGESLNRELDYYKKHTDELAGDNLKLDIAISALRRELKQKRQGFSLLSELQQAIGAHKEISSIFEITVKTINATLGMDKTVVLMPTDEESCYRPSQWAGFSQENTQGFMTMSLRLPEEFRDGYDFLLINKSSEVTPSLEKISTSFDLPYFICLPVMVENLPIALLLSGRMKDAKPYYPTLDQGDVDTFQAIAGLISASIRNLRLAVFKEMDRLKTEFFANVSHEFRTPITLTLGPLQQILEGRYGHVEAPIRSQLMVVQRNQIRLLDLVNQILDVIKLETGRMQLRAEPMGDINRFVEERVQFFRTIADQRDIELRVSLDPEVSRTDLFIDGEQFDKLLLNLLSNAFKFTNQGYIEVTTAIQERTFRLTVGDSGIGIKQDDLPHVFNRFWQASGSEARQHAGTGLGLALVKEIAELHGGKVTIYSQYGKGTLFQVFIPLGKAHLDPSSVVELGEYKCDVPAESQNLIIVEAEDSGLEVAEKTNQEAEAALDPGKSTILYVEDNPDLRNYVRTLLLSHYNVFLAVNGNDGLIKARKYKPDLILADQMMPGMSGRALLRVIRDDGNLHLTPVIFLTARASTESRIESLDAGADDYLAKPFDEGELLVRVRNRLRLSAQERELTQLNKKLQEKTQALEASNVQLLQEMEERNKIGQALKEAYDVLERRVAERTIKLKEALEEIEALKNRLQVENIYLQQEIKLTHNFEEIISRSKNFTKIVLEKVEQVAGTDATVLILGETGTGKELIARAIHSISLRKDRPLVKVNCAALPANLIESDLFGHEKGAFTNALYRKLGRFEIAHGGTIFLDEIGDLPLDLQVKLLRVLQEGEFERLGSPHTIKVDVRVIAATNRDLDKSIREGSFRQDLFYRLNVFPIRCLPLRERKEDIPLLVEHFSRKYCLKTGKRIKTVSSGVMQALIAYDWPGNVRELENVIERAIIVSRGENLEVEDWLPGTPTPQSSGSSLMLEEKDRRHIIEILQLTGWRVRGPQGAAELLGLKPTTLEAKMKKLKIVRPK